LRAEERTGPRPAAVLAADAELEIPLRLAAALAGHGDELSHALLVELLERVGGEDPLLPVLPQGTPRVVAAEAVGHLRQVVSAEGEEVRVRGDPIRHHAGAGNL